MKKNPFRKGDEKSGPANPGVRIITAQNFFGKKNNGYIEKAEFLAWGELSRDEDIAQVEKFITLAKAGRRIINTSTTRIDQGEVPYKFLTFLRSSQSTDGVKLIINGTWGQILDEVQDGIIKVEFTLEELIEEARK